VSEIQPCIACGAKLEPAFNDEESPPHNGLVFEAHGNYGSTLYDNGPLQGRWLQVTICDDCVAGYAALVEIVALPRTFRTQPFKAEER
jgi:hypothetical protein